MVLLFLFIFFLSILVYLNLIFSLNEPHKFAQSIQKNLSTNFAEKWLTSRWISTPGHLQRPSEALLVKPEYFCSVNVFVIL